MTYFPKTPESKSFISPSLNSTKTLVMGKSLEYNVPNKEDIEELRKRLPFRSKDLILQGDKVIMEKIRDFFIKSLNLPSHLRSST